MCLPERKTLRRGRPAAAWRSAWRVRRWRRAKRALRSDMGPLLLLAFLAPDGLGRILDALALVRLGRTQAADFGGDLADLLAIGAGNLDRGRPRGLHLNAGRNGHLDVVAEAELQLQVLGVGLGAIAHAVDLEVDGEAVGHTLHHVVGLGAGGAPLHARAAAVAARLEGNALVRLGDLDVVMDDEGQLAPLSLDLESLALEVDSDALGDDDWILADAR